MWRKIVNIDLDGFSEEETDYKIIHRKDLVQN